MADYSWSRNGEFTGERTLVLGADETQHEIWLTFLVWNEQGLAQMKIGHTDYDDSDCVRYGTIVELTTDELRRVKQAIEQVLSMSPALITGTPETEGVKGNTGNIGVMGENSPGM